MRRTIATAAAFAAVLVLAPLAARARAADAPPPATHEVRMVMDGAAPRFEPAALTVRPGDRVRFVNASGGPHNVAFDPDRVPDAAEAALAAGMPGQMQRLWGPLLTEPDAAYTLSLAGVPAGTYEFFCLPHVAMGMKGTLTVR